MITRVYYEEADGAEEAAEILYGRGHEVAVIKERFAGEDDDEDLFYVLATPAPEAEVRAALELDEDVWLETDEA